MKKKYSFKNAKPIPFGKLEILAVRAIEIDDPALNIIMMNLGLYEGVHDKNAGEIIAKLRKLIDKSTDNKIVKQ